MCIFYYHITYYNVYYTLRVLEYQIDISDNLKLIIYNSSNEY